MITYYEKKDIISFGNYILSTQREDEGNIITEEDFYNWMIHPDNKH